jgi:phage repressor protein C with HTH and peptisase S24 domain
MRPTLGPGDVLLVRPADQAREGQVVAARFLAGPRHIVVKRVNGRVENGYWLASDDPDRGRDSRQHGPAQVVGLVLLAWPGDGGWLRRLVPTTVRSRQPARER